MSGMAEVCVITGGGSGMGLAAAKFMPAEKIIVISGRTVSKLEGAAEELRQEGHTVYCRSCDTSDRESVRKLAEFAKSLGTIRNVINSAGLSPNMADGVKVLKVNALGTVYVNPGIFKGHGKGQRDRRYRLQLRLFPPWIHDQTRLEELPVCGDR